MTSADVPTYPDTVLPSVVARVPELVPIRCGRMLATPFTGHDVGGTRAAVAETVGAYRLVDGAERGDAPERSADEPDLSAVHQPADGVAAGSRGSRRRSISRCPRGCGPRAQRDAGRRALR